MPWQLITAKRAQRQLERLPAKDQRYIMAALAAMRENPFAGDIARLESERATWRRRVGNYRIFFDAYSNEGRVEIVEISRRTSTTY